MESKEYLEPGFDPNTLKVAQLRGILNEYDVDYASNLKKKALVELFQAHIAPNAKNLLLEQEQAVKNSHNVGIADASGRPLRRSRRAVSQELKSDRGRDEEADVKKEEEDEEEGEEEEESSGSTQEVEMEEVENEDSSVKDSLREVEGESDKKDDKESSSFTNDNVFQSPPSTAEKPKKGSAKSSVTSTPGSRKRRSDNFSELSSRKKQHKSPGSPPNILVTKSPNQKTPNKPGHLFEDNETTDSDSDIFSKSIISQVKSPRKAKSKSPALKMVDELGGTPSANKRSGKKSIAKSSPASADGNEPSKDLKLENKHSPSIVNNNNSNKVSSIEDEIKDFDREAEKINNRNKTKDKSSDGNLLSAELASQLGIKIEGMPVRDIELTENSFASPRLNRSVEIPQLRIIRHKNKTQDNRMDINKTKSEGFDKKFESNNTRDGEYEQSLRKSEKKDEKEDDEDDEDEEDGEEDEEGDNDDEEDEDEDEEDVSEEKNKIATKVSEQQRETKLKNAKKADDNLASGVLKIKYKRTSLLSIFLFLILWVAILSIGLFGYWFREQTYSVGYCGHEIDKPTFHPAEDLPSWLHSLGDFLDSNYKPKCVPCPPHARCFENLELGCYEDFVEYKPFYFDYLPIVYPELKKCVPDTKKAEKLEIMIEVTLDLLRSKNANRNCGSTPISSFEAGLTAEEIHELLLMMKAPYISNEEFEELWERSLIELEKEPEVITGSKGTSYSTNLHSNNTREEEKEDKIFRSTSLSNLNLKCQLQNTIVGTIIEYREYIFAIIALVVLYNFISYEVKQIRREKTRVDSIYNEVLNKLKAQSQLAKKANGGVSSYIGSTQLRDLILTNEKNLTKKLNIWKRVNSKVESNSNVKYHLVENHGEIMKVYEWITDVDVDF